MEIEEGVRPRRITPSEIFFSTVGVSVMQCLITLFNHAEISLIRSEDCLLCLWRM